jgi:hypothetical protein
MLMLELNKDISSPEYHNDNHIQYQNNILENQKVIIAMLNEKKNSKLDPSFHANTGILTNPSKSNNISYSDPASLLRDYNDAINPRSSAEWQGFISKYGLKAMSYSSDTGEFTFNEMGMVSGCNLNGEYYLVPSNRIRTIDQSAVEQYKNIFELEGSVFSTQKLSDYKLLEAAIARKDNTGKIIMQRKGRMKRITQ